MIFLCLFAFALRVSFHFRCLLRNKKENEADQEPKAEERTLGHCSGPFIERTDRKMQKRFEIHLSTILSLRENWYSTAATPALDTVCENAIEMMEEDCKDLWEEYKQDEPITEDKIWPAPQKA